MSRATPSSAGPTRRGALAAICLLLAAPARPADVLDEIVVTTERRSTALADVAASIAGLPAADIVAIGAQHPHELFTRVAGAWVSRGSGQESLTAIRSPVLSGAGACGAFMTLEDGIPTRPPGFCNVNQLFELNTEQAQAIEVLRGPGNALYGANALHGLVNVRMPEPGADGFAAIEAGGGRFLRLQAGLPLATSDRAYGSVLVDHDDGFRADTGYRQVKAYGTAQLGDPAAGFRVAVSATDLSQDTGGYILGEDAYKDEALRVSNPNPEAFRDAASQRLYGVWSRQSDGGYLDVRPYVRHSSMTFLQHFLPGQPLEDNRQTSAGVLVLAERKLGGTRVKAGADVDVADIRLLETQAEPAEGSPFLVATRPAGKHYDYSVRSIDLAAYVEGRWTLGSYAELGTGLRLEYTRYAYDNRMLDGNTKDDGEPCGFGGCLYTRPSDRDDDFLNLAPHLTISVPLSERTTAYLRASRGFRPPQTTELYRLQSGQASADLATETIDALEAGVHLRRGTWNVDGALYAMRKKDSVLRDADGYTVNGGRTRHAGAELEVDGRLAPALRLSLSASYAEHRYDFDSVAAQGETFVSGNVVDTAPRWLGSIDLAYTPTASLDIALQWTTVGRYFIDAENLHDYPGHALWNARVALTPTAAWQFVLRLNNLTDERYADRADYAFGNYRYFPGRAREAFLELRYRAGAD